MKLSPRDATAYLSRPEPALPALLIYGADPMRVALKRQELIAAMIGPEGEAEMRLSRHPAADLRKDPALLSDALKATGFFPGRRVVFVEDAGDGVSQAIADALATWQEGDAHLVVTAGQLAPKSSLRKLFEGHSTAAAAAIYDDPPSRAEIEAELRKAGIRDIPREAMAEIEGLSRMLDPGDFRQTIEKLALYKRGDAEPLRPEDVLAVAPVSTEAELDDVIDIVAEARFAEIGPILRRLEAQGGSAVALCIAASRHFRTLHRAASDPEGPAKAITRVRPMVHFKRRDRVARQAQTWGTRRLEEAMRLLVETDLTLRSSSQAPDMAVMERALVRLAMLGQKR